MGRWYLESERRDKGVNVNKVILLGRVGTEIKLNNKGKTPVASFSMATSEKYSGKEYTTWHNIEVWDKLAEVVSKWSGKGKRIFIEGKLKTDSWDKDGQKQYITKVVAKNIEIIDFNNAEDANLSQIDSSKYNNITDVDVDDIPF